uniref:putative E3 ubiquitin-protein ligase ARI4 n=1 Tax=Erigeron canadensis TaxID=72917 RepID=UPI001CB97896|nr:putative E3 ubiquitin-protein ligase ARI4 [Erigeron canadensis]
MGNTIPLTNCFNRIDRDQTFTCEICMEPDILLNFKFNNNNKRCRRRHPFCTDCMIKYIQVKLEANVSRIKCPAITCKRYLKPLSCRPKIASQVFEKWCDVLCESSVLRVDRAYCPNIECGELILNECGGDLTRCVCPCCKKPYCFRCKVPWPHEGRTICLKAEEAQNEVAFDHVSKLNEWQRCPGCRQCVERINGCNQVRCRCGTTFCYKCGKEDCKKMLHCPNIDENTNQMVI